MRTSIFGLWRGFFLCIIVVGVSGGYVAAQDKVSEQQKNEYAKGNRDVKFLKEYIAALKSDKKTEELNDAVDSYLMALPLAERYTGDYLVDFMSYVIHLDAKSLSDVIENWKKIPFSEEQAVAVTRKIEDISKMELFQTLVKEGGEKGRPGLDCSGVQAALRNSEIPVSDTKRLMIDMWQFWREKELTGMIRSFNQMMTKSLTVRGASAGATSGIQIDAVFEGVVLASMMNYMLEESDLGDCKEMIGIMNSALEKNGRDGFMETVGRMKDSFEGKQMMIEMGEE